MSVASLTFSDGKNRASLVVLDDSANEGAHLLDFALREHEAILGASSAALADAYRIWRNGNQPIGFPALIETSSEPLGRFAYEVEAYDGVLRAVRCRERRAGKSEQLYTIVFPVPRAPARH
jgi:hypothetical protein